MDLKTIQHQEATSSTFATSVAIPDSHNQQPSQPAVLETKVLRSSARVKAAKQKSKNQSSERIKDRDSTHTSQQLASSSAEPLADLSAPRNTRTSSRSKRVCGVDYEKGNYIEVLEETTRFSKRIRGVAAPISSSFTIIEPVRDAKGKKREISEPTSDQDDVEHSKRQRTSYSLRSHSQLQMPRKAGSAQASKEKLASIKSKFASSSRIEDEDIEMLDSTYNNDECAETDINNDVDTSEAASDNGHEKTMDAPGDVQGGGDCDHGEEEERDRVAPSSDGAPIPNGMDESTAMAIFGDFRQFGSYMMSLSSRLKTMFSNIKSTADPTTRLVALQELSELLSISTEDTLAGSFQVEQFVRELVKILGGRGNDKDEDEADEDDVADVDEDAALAAALSISASNTFQGDENLEAQVLACRCLANLMEALPGVAHTVVYHGAIPVLCSKLVEISYIDLAEQTLSTMEKISEEFPSSIVREGGLGALLNYLDFFSIAVQRTALQAASNCCRNLSSEHYHMISSVWPIIRSCLTYSDQRLVEFACLCVIRVVDSYYRASTKNLEALVDIELIRAVNQLLLPAGGSPLIAPNTYTLLIRSLATSAKASPKIALALLEADIVDTLYQILTGVLPSSVEKYGSSNGGQLLSGGVADMSVMENLAYRPKDQIEESLSLVSELMPPLPKDGVFDHKSYTEKSLSRMVKSKAKADRAAARQTAQANSSTLHVLTNSVVDSPSPEPLPESQNADPVEEPSLSGATEPKERVIDRTELLRSQPAVVGRFMQLMVPILLDVYAASVIMPVRVKSLTGFLKAISFLDADGLERLLTFVPVASFSSSILSSKDHPSLVIGALQIVDILLSKLPVLYKPAFRREGVFHEIEMIAERALASMKNKEKEKEKNKDKDSSESMSPDTGSTGPFSVSGASISGIKKVATMTLEPEDAITLRARVIQLKYLSTEAGEKGDAAFHALRLLVERISNPEASEKEVSDALKSLAGLFSVPHSSVSSFELLQSGVVEALLQFATVPYGTTEVSQRHELFLDAFSPVRAKGFCIQSPFATLVKKLQESLTRIESFDVVTVTQSGDDSKRSSPSLLARQLRLRLVAADDSDVPRNLHNIIVSIHAIATFQALHDYLRPRVAGLQNGGSRFHGMLAALAASGLSASSSRNVNPDNSQTSQLPVLNVENAAAESSAASTLERRRSQRLSAKNSSAESVEPAVSTVKQEPTTNGDVQITSEAGNIVGDLALSETVVDSELAADFTDEEEINADVFDDEDPDRSVSEKTVMLSVVEDGSKIVAQTPEGTRVATPNSSGKDGMSCSGRTQPFTKATYAAALKAKPTDWHLEFFINDHPLPLDLTIYGAIHQHEQRKKSGMSPSMIWQGVYTVKFKKVTGPPLADSRAEGADGIVKYRSPSPGLSTNTPHAKILSLLRVLHQLNTLETERSEFSGEKRNLAESSFVNNKLTAKLTRQLEEPMIVASSCLPDWSLDLPQHFPFIFPFATRYNFLQSTSFGYARLIIKWQSQQTQSRTQDSRRDEGIGFLGRLQRQKVRISRKHILESAVKVFELYGSSSSILEVEYFEEVGTGLGPTLEFYSLVSREFARKDLKIWRDNEGTSMTSPYVSHPSGLYPSPLSMEDIASDGEQKRIQLFRVIGQFVAKAMLDSRIIDLTFNKVFLKLVLGEEVPLTFASLKLVDIDLANSLSRIESIAVKKNQTSNDKFSPEVEKVVSISVEDIGLDFTIPGYDIELRPGGRNIAVTSENVHGYMHDVLNSILGKGTRLQVQAFRDGFSKVFPITDLRAFSADELVMLFGNSDEDWSQETLAEAVKADHGFNTESRAIHDLLDIISKYDPRMRRAFLQFITGSPKLPIGGFRGLNPLLTVVRKPHEAPYTADDYLPSVMTCVNYLKLPEYSSKIVMQKKLQIAIQEGVGSFHLS